MNPAPAGPPTRRWGWGLWKGKGAGGCRSACHAAARPSGLAGEEELGSPDTSAGLKLGWRMQQPGGGGGGGGKDTCKTSGVVWMWDVALASDQIRGSLFWLGWVSRRTRSLVDCGSERARGFLPPPMMIPGLVVSCYFFFLFSPPLPAPPRPPPPGRLSCLLNAMQAVVGQASRHPL